MPDRYANGDPSNDRGGLTGAARGHRLRPDRHRLLPRRRPQGPDRRLHRHAHRARADQGARLHRDLGDAAVAQQAVQGDSAAYHGYWGLDFTRVDPHLGTERGLRRVRRLRAPPRDEGLPRRRRQPHRRRDPARRRLDLPSTRTSAVPRLQGQAVLRRSATLARSRSRACRAATMPRQPFVLPAEPQRKTPAWLNDVTRYHNRGDIDFDSLLARLLRAGRLLRARRPLHRAAVRRERARGGVRRLDPPLQGRRLPRRHGEARRPRVLPALGAEDPRRGACGRRAATSRSSARCSITDAVELSSFVRDRGVPNVIDFPLQDALVRYAGGSAGARGIATRLADDDYFRGAAGRRADAGDLPRQPRHRPRRAQIQEQAQAEGAELARARDLLGYEPPLPAAGRARRLLRRRGRDDRPRRRQGSAPGHVPDAGRRVADARSASARRRSATARRSTSSAIRSPRICAARRRSRANPALSTGASIVRVAQRACSR